MSLKQRNLDRAKCTVLVIQLFLQNCAQPNEDRTYVLPHIIDETCSFLSLLTSHSLFPRILSLKTKNFNPQKKIAGLRPVPPPCGAGHIPPTQAGVKCLAAVVLDNQDRALHHRLKMNSNGATNEAPTCAVTIHTPQTSSLR